MSALSREAELAGWVRLNLVPEIGAVRFHRLLRAFGSPEGVFRAGAAELERRVPGIGGALARALLDPALRDRARDELQLAGRLGVRLVRFRDPDYPANLLNCYEPPPLLYVKGDLLESDRRAVAVVGTRQPTDYGRQWGSELSRGLARSGYCLVSGLARGLDTLAHRAALEEGGRTLAVLGCGLAGVYPPENDKLAAAIAEGRGALVSQFPLEAPPEKKHFPMRNALISGLSLGVLVVEGEEDSGSLITADFALEQGREVFALPGPLDSKKSAGPLKLIQQGAKLVRGLKDILDELPARAAPAPSKGPAQGLLFSGEAPEGPGLDGQEAILHAILKEKGRLHLDELAGLTGMAAGPLSASMTLLELKGAARQLPGNYFEAG